jgi:hypothetical protein
MGIFSWTEVVLFSAMAMRWAPILSSPRARLTACRPPGSATKAAAGRCSVCRGFDRLLLLEFCGRLICCERKTLLNGWLISADKHKRTGCWTGIWLVLEGFILS